ncbi:hypothetical protein [Dysosmobacter sp.]|nr:hypothetical protein [Dysosmobacter sp.]MDY3281407.1 hypothetical protein [Dysosmobacter sp.]
MADHHGKKQNYAGGVGLLLATVCVCYQALKRVEARLKEKAEKKK